MVALEDEFRATEDALTELVRLVGHIQAYGLTHPDVQERAARVRDRVHAVAAAAPRRKLAVRIDAKHLTDSVHGRAIESALVGGRLRQLLHERAVAGLQIDAGVEMRDLLTLARMMLIRPTALVDLGGPTAWLRAEGTQGIDVGGFEFERTLDVAEADLGKTLRTGGGRSLADAFVTRLLDRNAIEADEGAALRALIARSDQLDAALAGVLDASHDTHDGRLAGAVDRLLDGIDAHAADGAEDADEDAVAAAVAAADAKLADAVARAGGAAIRRLLVEAAGEPEFGTRLHERVVERLPPRLVARAAAGALADPNVSNFVFAILDPVFVFAGTGLPLDALVADAVRDMDLVSDTAAREGIATVAAMPDALPQGWELTRDTAWLLVSDVAAVQEALATTEDTRSLSTLLAMADPAPEDTARKQLAAATESFHATPRDRTAFTWLAGALERYARVGVDPAPVLDAFRGLEDVVADPHAAWRLLLSPGIVRLLAEQLSAGGPGLAAVGPAAEAEAILRFTTRPDAVGILLDVASDADDRRARGRVQTLLREMRDGVVEGALARLDGPWYAVRNMLRLLVGTTAPHVVERVLPLLRHADARVVREAVQVLAAVHEPAVTTQLAALVVQPEHLADVMVLAVLERRELTDEAFTSLAECLLADGLTADAGARLASLLVRAREDRAIRALAARLDKENDERIHGESLAVHVAQTLARLGTPRARAALERFAHASRRPVRRACTDALAAMGGHP